MKRENRLTHSTDFERVRRYGKSYAHPLILLQVAKRDDNELKAGIVVSRTIGSAVIRNHTKRRVRECLSEIFPMIQTGWDLVLVPRRLITKASYEEINTVCLSLLIRGRINRIFRGIKLNSQELYSNEPKLKDMPVTFITFPRIILLGLIRGYQKIISPSLPQNSCRFYPSCSHYGYQSIYKYGVIKGSLMAAWRILRCNPFNPGGYDPVP